MTFLTHRGEGPSFTYAGQPVHILAGGEGQPQGFAAMEITIPARFGGPVPHLHEEFDEAIYIVHGRLRVAGDAGPQDALAGSMFTAPRGQRHAFSNPHDETAIVLGLWSPAAPGIAFMRDVGAVLTASGPPDPDRMREVYERHASRLVP